MNHVAGVLPPGMQSVSLLALSLVLSSFLPQPVAAQNDPQAGKILDAMTTKYAALKSFQATFTQTLENPAAKLKQNFSGEMTVSGPKYHFISNGQEVFSDGQTTWTYSKGDNEVTISDSDLVSQEITPPQIFTIAKKDYKYQLLSTVKESGMICDQVEMYSLDKTNDVFKLHLRVIQADKSLQSLKMFKKNGTHTTFALKNFKPNVTTTVGTFTFDTAQHPSVKVVDLRSPKRGRPQQGGRPQFIPLRPH